MVHTIVTTPDNILAVVTIAYPKHNLRAGYRPVALAHSSLCSIASPHITTNQLTCNPYTPSCHPPSFTCTPHPHSYLARCN